MIDKIEVQYLSYPKKGEEHNGDRVVCIGEKGCFIAGIIDGLGHGEQASIVSGMALEVIEENRSDELDVLLKKMDMRLKNTRGVVAGLLRFETRTRTVSFSGMGNIGVRSTNEDIHPFSVGGILGRDKHSAKVLSYTYNESDLFVLYSDGISGSFDIGELKDETCEKIVKRIMENHRNERDDSTVLAIKIKKRRDEL